MGTYGHEGGYAFNEDQRAAMKEQATAQFTSGPWNWERPFEEPGIYVAAPDTSLLARVYEQGGFGVANARLMAASPDLLKACDEADTAFACLNICEGITPQARHALREAWALVNAAMAKAKGKPDAFAEVNPEVSAAALAKHN